MIKKWKKGKWSYELCLEGRLITLSKRGGAETIGAPGEIMFYSKTLESEAAAFTAFDILKDKKQLSPQKCGFLLTGSAILN